jgi:hypothetical protein
MMPRWSPPAVQLLSDDWPPRVLRVPRTPRERLIAGFFRRIELTVEHPEYVALLGPCFRWTGSIHDHRYGIFSSTRVHIFAYWLFLGQVSEDDNVLHKCNYRPCVRPGHLYLGTQAMNMAQKVADGRARGGVRPGQVGELNNSAKVATGQAQYALDLYAAGYRQVDIAWLARLTQSNAHNIVRRETWKHLVPNPDAIPEPPLIPRHERRRPRKGTKLP